MPTGFTAYINEGCTFREYALRCARHFGACIDMRDESMDKLPRRPSEMKKEVPNNNYHKNRYEEAKKDLECFINLPEEDKRAKFEKEIKEKIKDREDWIKDKLALKEKYENMLKKCREFIPPTEDHNAHKNFMINQIEESIKFDCNTKYDEEEIHRLKKQHFDSWCIETIRDLKWTIEHCLTEMKREEQIVDNRGEWLEKLFDTLDEMEEE